MINLINFNDFTKKKKEEEEQSKLATNSWSSIQNINNWRLRI